MTARHYAPVVLGLWLVTVVGQASVGAPTEVKVVGGRVHINATAASVSEVLDRLSRTTGMKIVYDGAPPTDRLTAAIDAGSETEALSRLLEGLGLTYAFKLDTAGRHVETLFVSSSSRRSGTAVATTASAPRPIQFQPSADDDALPPEEPDPADDPAAMAAQGVVTDSAGMATTGAPGGYAGGGQVGGVPGVAGAPGFEAQSPEIPGAASFPSPGTPSGPTPPVTPGFPTFPGPVSYT